MQSIRHFFSSIATLAKQHPVAFAVTVVLIPIVLGGLSWKLVGMVRKVPGGSAVAGAVQSVAKATGSA